jgi:hypothetical protein
MNGDPSRRKPVTWITSTPLLLRIPGELAQPDIDEDDRFREKFPGI